MMGNNDDRDDFPWEESKTKLLHFRPLRADEVEVRSILKSKENPRASLLLYQDARSAMNILDLTVGPKGWQKEYYEASGLLFCRIGIYDQETQQWLWKADTGSKSNIEEDKGLASDAFKRAAVAWGIGRELYTAPSIIIDLTDKDLFNNKISQTFKVAKMSVTDGVITELVIVDRWENTRFVYPKASSKKEQAIMPVRPSQTTQLAPQKWDSESEVDQLDEELVIEDKIFKQPSPTEIMEDYCSRLKQEPGVNLKELDKFNKWLHGPDRDNPQILRVEGIAKKYKEFKPEELWKGWLKNVRS